MPTELEELVEFLHHGNTQIRQVAAEHLVGYSSSDPSLFKRNELEPIKDLKLLVRDYAVVLEFVRTDETIMLFAAIQILRNSPGEKPIAKNALDMLINLSDDPDVLKFLAEDNAFIETIMQKITAPKEENANSLAILLANLAKHQHLKIILEAHRAIPSATNLSTSPLAMDQLMDCFVKGSEGKYNPQADYNYLSYVFADMAKYAEGRKYLIEARKEDGDVIPLTKLVVFTEYRKSVIRRRGVASTIKNVCFEIDAHSTLIDCSDKGVNLLPYILLPLMGSEEYSDEDTEGMLEDLQLLEPDKEREPDLEIIKTHLESLLLLTTTKDVREHLRRIKVYPIIREVHLHIEDEEVREACDRVVQVLMRDEEPEDGREMLKEDELAVAKAQEVDEEEEIIDVV